MRQKTDRRGGGWRAAGVVAATAGACVIGVPGEARADWTFEQVRGGGYAQTCNSDQGQRVCAVVYCGRGVDDLRVGLKGWEPRGQGDQRTGPIRVDGRGRDVRYVRESNPVLGTVWRVEIGNSEGRLIERIKNGLDLGIDIAARSPAFQFTLDGSHDAISQLQRRCSARGGDGRRDVRDDRREQDGRDRRRARQDDGTLRFGSDDLGFELTFGEDGVDFSLNDGERNRGRLGWTVLGANLVDRRRDRDVIDLGRRDGRFDAIRLQARRNDVRIREVRVRYGNGVEHGLNVDRILTKGGRSGTIGMRGRSGRFIDRVTLIYATRGRGPKALVRVMGRRTRS